MKYRMLGTSGLKVSVVGVGTWQYGGEWGRSFTADEVTAILRRAQELGINLLDTAECYGDHLSEELVGQALQNLGSRDQWIVATKFGHKFNAPFERSEPRTGRDIQQQLEASLRALQVEVIDLYQYHSWGDADFDRADVLEVLRKAQQAGKVRHLGNSISGAIGKDPAQLHQVEASAQHHVAALQVVYNRLDRAPEQALFPRARELNLGVLARVPLASGYLSGKYHPGAAFPTNDVRAKWGSQEARDKTLQEVEEIQKSEVPAGVPMAQWALAWCLKHPAVTSVIPGCKTPEQVESNAAAAGMDLVRDDHPQAAG